MIKRYEIKAEGRERERRTTKNQERVLFLAVYLKMAQGE
jgi:hypothetical protein